MTTEIITMEKDADQIALDLFLAGNAQEETNIIGLTVLQFAEMGNY